MDVSAIRVKITNVDTASNTLSVIWSSDQSRRPVDEYTTFVVPLDQFPQDTTSTSAVLEHLAILGIQECQKQYREENAQFETLLTELTQEIGVVTEFNLNTLLPPIITDEPLPDEPLPDAPV